MTLQMDRQSAHTIAIACRAQLEKWRDQNAQNEMPESFLPLDSTCHLARLLELYNRSTNILHGNHIDYDVMRVPYWMDSGHAR